MSEARAAILERIRQARQGSASMEIPYEAIQRNYLQETALDRNEILDFFEDRLHDYGAGVRRCSLSHLPGAIAAVAAERGIEELLITSNVPAEWLPASLRFFRDDQLPYGEIDRIGGVLTRCAQAIAETGTIVLRHSALEGRRALTLIPDYHLCIVETDQVTRSVVEGIRSCESFKLMPITTISGPSATSDIEMTRIKGVHGPRTLDVVLVQSPYGHGSETVVTSGPA